MLKLTCIFFLCFQDLRQGNHERWSEKTSWMLPLCVVVWLSWALPLHMGSLFSLLSCRSCPVDPFSPWEDLSDAWPPCPHTGTTVVPRERRPLLRQLLHGMASLDLPYRCPRCGEHKRFRSLSSLRAHLEYNHTYETLYVLSKSNSVCDAAALLPLVAEGALLAPANNNDPFEPLRPSALKERRFPCRELPCADDLSLTPANSNTAARYIPNVEFPLGEIFMKKAMTSTDPGPHGNPSTAVAVAANVAASAVEAAYEEGLARLKARAFERLELDERLEKLSEEVNRIIIQTHSYIKITSKLKHMLLCTGKTLAWEWMG